MADFESHERSDGLFRRPTPEPDSPAGRHAAGYDGEGHLTWEHLTWEPALSADPQPWPPIRFAAGEPTDPLQPEATSASSTEPSADPGPAGPALPPLPTSYPAPPRAWHDPEIEDRETPPSIERPPVPPPPIIAPVQPIAPPPAPAVTTSAQPIAPPPPLPITHVQPAAPPPLPAVHPLAPPPLPTAHPLAPPPLPTAHPLAPPPPLPVQTVRPATAEPVPSAESSSAVGRVIIPRQSADSPPNSGPSIELSVVVRAETTDNERSVLPDWSVAETAFRKAVADLLDARTRLLALAVGRSSTDVIPDGHGELQATLYATGTSLTQLQEWLAQH